MMQEFFGKPFYYALSSLFILLLSSSIGYFFHLSTFFLILIGIVTVFATVRKLEYGLLIAFLELLSNAHGFLFFTSVDSFRISARMVIFLAVFFGFSISLLRKRLSFFGRDFGATCFFPLMIAIVWGFIIGLTKRNALDVFRDGNAYFYLLYLLPILHVEWSAIKKHVMLQCLAAGMVFTTSTSVLILYAYTHFSEPFLKMLYVFLRDIRFAEITRLPFGMYRVFEQMHLFAFLFGLILLPRLFSSQTKHDRLITIFLTSLVFFIALIGMSRSFWFGFAFTSIVCAGLFVFLQRPLMKTLFLGILHVGAACALSLFLLAGTVFFPWPHDRTDGNAITSIFDSRLSDTSDVAVTSRWNLLIPMREMIMDAPFFGNGFGQTVTFKTDDPRARAIRSDGTWTTSSMEWGWLEVWLKMGFMAPIGFIFLFLVFIRRARAMFSTPKEWIGIWIISSLVFISATHVFSPYLNHPLGLGVLLFLFIFLPPDSRVRFFALLYFLKQKMPNPRFAASTVQTVKSKETSN